MPNEPFIATCKASDLAAVKEHGLPILETLQKEALHDFLSFQPGLQRMATHLPKSAPSSRIPR